MFPTRNPTLNRVMFASCLLGAWALPSILIYVFLTSDMPGWYRIVGASMISLMYVVAFVMTFVVGGLRYVLTGSEFPEDRT